MPFVPDGYTPPRTHRFAQFTIEVLLPNFAVQDYAAVTMSADAILHVFGPLASGGSLHSDARVSPRQDFKPDAIRAV